MRDLEDDRIVALDSDSSIPSIRRPLSDLSAEELRESDREVLRLQRSEPFDPLRERMADHRIRIFHEVERRGEAVYDEVYRS